MAYARTTRRGTSARRSSSRATSRRSTSSARRSTRSSARRSSSSTSSSSSSRAIRSTRSGASKATQATNYSPIRKQIEQKIRSFQLLKAQTEGRATSTSPSASTLNRWANLVAKGAIVHELAGSRIARLTRQPKSKPCASATSCQRALQRRYGKAAIKGVVQSKTGQFLVATAPKQSNGQPFSFPR